MNNGNAHSTEVDENINDSSNVEKIGEVVETNTTEETPTLDT